MSTDGEPLLTIGQIAAKLPGGRGNARPSPSTITRWILTGVRGLSGSAIKLKATRAGYRWLLRESDVEAFFNALGTMPEPQPEVRSPTARTKAADVAGMRLAGLGA